MLCGVSVMGRGGVLEVYSQGSLQMQMERPTRFSASVLRLFIQLREITDADYQYPARW